MRPAGKPLFMRWSPVRVLSHFLFKHQTAAFNFYSRLLAIISVLYTPAMFANIKSKTTRLLHTSVMKKV